MQIVYRYVDAPIAVTGYNDAVEQHIERLRALPAYRSLYQRRTWTPGYVGGRGVGPQGLGLPLGAFEWDPVPELEPGVLLWCTGATRPASLITVLPGSVLLTARNHPAPLLEIVFLDDKQEVVDRFSLPMFPVGWVRIGWLRSPYPYTPVTTTTTTNEYEEADEEAKKGRPDPISLTGVYLVLLSSWSYFLREVRVSLRDTSSWAAVARQVFHQIARHPILGRYLQAREIRQYSELFVYLEGEQRESIPGYDEQPEYLATTSTTTSTTTTTTTYECIPKSATTTTTTTTTTTSTSTTTTTSDYEYNCLTVPNTVLWQQSDIPADSLIDALAAHLCAIPHVTDIVYIRKIGRPAAISGPRTAGAIIEGTAVQSLYVLAPVCRDGVFPEDRSFDNWTLPIAPGELQIAIVESNCSKDCLYRVLFPIHRRLWRRLGRGGKVAEYALAGIPLLPEQTDWLRIDLHAARATIRSLGAAHWPRHWGWDCPTTTTTTPPGYNPGYTPGKVYPEKARETAHPCTSCFCYWTCIQSTEGYYWVKLDDADECHQPCFCPEPVEVECDSDVIGASWSVSCDEEAPCEGSLASWRWVQTGQRYTEGHWELEEPCPEGCEACYPEFCCDEETIVLEEHGTTTQDYECKSTYTQCVQRERKQDECPEESSFPEGRDCTTSTSTTTPEVCEGECSWVWTEYGFVRTDTDDPETMECSTGCHCCYPSECEDIDVGDVAFGECRPSKDECPEVPEECQPLDELCGPWPVGHPCCDELPSTTTTTTRDCDCETGRCVWYAAPPYGDLYLVSNTCCPDCPCAAPPPVDICEYTESRCIRRAPPIRPRPLRCRGQCTYIWCEWPDRPAGWVLYTSTCRTGDALECEYRTWSGRVRRERCQDCVCAGPPEKIPCQGSCVWECRGGQWIRVHSCEDFGDDSGCQCPDIALPVPCYDGNRVSGRCEGENSRPVCGTIGIAGCMCVCPRYNCTEPPP